MAKINVLLHKHRHGEDVVAYRGGEGLSLETIAARLGLDYEADREDESLEDYNFEESEITNVDEVEDPEPKLSQGSDEDENEAEGHEIVGDK